MSSQESGGAAGRRETAPEGGDPDEAARGSAAPEGKDPDAPGPAGGAAPEGNDAGEGGDAVTEARHDTLEARMKEDGFDINDTPCGPLGRIPMDFALGGKGEPYDEKAVKLVLGTPGLGINRANERGATHLVVQSFCGRSRNIALLLADGRIDPNRADDVGRTSLHLAASLGNDRCVEVLLADPRVDPNLGEKDGCTALYGAADHGRPRCVELLLSDSRVDPNILNSTTGNTPLNTAANLDRVRCVELLLADRRVDVCRACMDGQTPLISACIQLMKSMDQVGAPEGDDPARCLVVMLKSRRIPKHNLKYSITFLGPAMPTQRQIDTAEAGGEPLEPNQKMARLVIPVLLAHLNDEFRWCAHCLKLTPELDLRRCGGCNQVGYCDEAPPGQKPCHVAHWKAGHKKECARFAAEAEELKKAEEEEGGMGGGEGGGGGGDGGSGGGASLSPAVESTRRTRTVDSQESGGAAGQNDAPEGKDAGSATTRRCGFPSCSAAEGEVTKKCAACGAMWYCSRDHQRGHWKEHKADCRFGKVRDGAGGGAGTAVAAEGKDAGEGGDGDAGKQRATEARYDTLGAMMKDDAFDINMTRCGPLRLTPLNYALGAMGDPYDEKAVKLVLGSPGLDVNMTSAEGATALSAQCSYGKSRNVELLLADDRVDVSLASATGQTPLVSACMQLMFSMHQVGAPGGSDPARTLVIMLKSRRLPKRNVEETITFMGDSMPTQRQIDAAAAGGRPLDSQQKTCLIVLPVLLAHLKGEFRWCAHCLKLTPDVDLHQCGGCNQVGYCDEAPPGQKKPCHKAHWKAGHKQECALFQAEAKAKAEAEAAEAEATAGAAGGGGGGKKGKKGKNRRG